MSTVEVTAERLCPKDADSGVELAETVKNDFAGYKESEFREAFISCAKNSEAVGVKHGNKLAALLLFSLEKRELLFLAVHPNFRRLGYGVKMFEEMLSDFNKGDVIEVFTFREKDAKGVSAINFYKSVGFVCKDELTVFDYPCMRMIFTVK